MTYFKSIYLFIYLFMTWSYIKVFASSLHRNKCRDMGLTYVAIIH